MKVKLPYGQSCIEATVSDTADLLLARENATLEDEKDSAFNAFSDPIDAPPLEALAGRDDTIAIVISDITRPTPNHKIVPWILEALADHPRENIVVINGTGSHRPNTDAELMVMLGEEIFRSVRVVNHSAFDPLTLTCLGTGSSGQEVYLNKEYCRADVRIVTGFIEPHFFAGFSGGAKGIMPGVAGLETIMHFHSATLVGHPNSTFGRLEDNPIQRMAREVALMCKPDFAVNVTLNHQGGITGIYAGDVIAAHRRGSAAVKTQSMIPCKAPYDIVVTTNGGYPLDQNLYQSVKGMAAAREIVRSGGDIICVAACSEGMPDHGNFSKILRMRDSPGRILEMVTDPGFSMYDQWEAQKLAMIQLWSGIHLLSELPRRAVMEAHLTPVDTLESTLGRLTEKHGCQPRIAVLPQGPQTIPYLCTNE